MEVKTTREVPNYTLKRHTQGIFSGPVVKNSPTNAWDTSSIPGLGRSHTPRSAVITELST